MCPVAGCGKPGKGPRFRFFCEDHRDLPKAEQNKILAAAATTTPKAAKQAKRKAAKKAAPKRKPRKTKAPDKAA